MSLLIVLHSLPVLVTALFCPSIHGPPPGSALHNGPSLSAAGWLTPTAKTLKQVENHNKQNIPDSRLHCKNKAYFLTSVYQIIKYGWVRKVDDIMGVINVDPMWRELQWYNDIIEFQALELISKNYTKKTNSCSQTWWLFNSSCCFSSNSNWTCWLALLGSDWLEHWRGIKKTNTVSGCCGCSSMPRWGEKWI